MRLKTESIAEAIRETAKLRSMNQATFTRLAKGLKATPLGRIVETPGTFLDKRADGFWLKGYTSKWSKIDLAWSVHTYFACCQVANIPV